MNLLSFGLRLLLLGGLALAPAAAAPVGTFPTATWYETVYTDSGDTIWFQVHYPALSATTGADADPSAGPYPVALMMHGYLGQAWMYQTVCDAVASMGVVVLNLDTETHPWMDPYVLADDTQVAHDWLEEQSAMPGSWLAGMADGGPRIAMSQSMGGIAMARLVELNPRVETVIGFNPYRDGDYLWDAYVDFAGAGLFLTGDEDTTSTPEIVRAWFDDVDHPRRGLFAVMQGAGHQAATDIELEPATLSDAAQLEATVTVATAFLAAEVFGDEAQYDTLVCSSPQPWTELAANASLPASAAEAVSDSALRMGLVGASGQIAVVYGGTGPGDGETASGNSGLRLPEEIGRIELPDGVACVDLTLPPALAGVAWVQVAYTGADTVWGRPIDVFETGAAPVDTGEPEDTGRPTDTASEASPGADTAASADGGGEAPAAEAGATPAKGCGCANGPSGGGGALFLAGLGFLLCVRRHRC